MKRNSHLLFMMLVVVFPVSTAQAAGMQNNGVYASHYNPWRPQPPQWGIQNGQNDIHVEERQHHVEAWHDFGVRSKPLYSAPVNTVIPARQFEYRRYIQQVNPYYGNQMPWWSDPVAVPYGPWSFGNNGINGFW